LFTFCDYDAHCLKFRQNPAGSAHLGRLIPYHGQTGNYFGPEVGLGDMWC
jgi:hypothetical protein